MKPVACVPVAIEFRSREQQHSEYDWADISSGGDRVGKARCKIETSRLTICSINIYPQWAQRGYGREFVEWCKYRFPVVIADRVRHRAIGFWAALGFRDNQDGNWIYVNESTPPPP